MDPQLLKESDGVFNHSRLVNAAVVNVVDDYSCHVYVITGRSYTKQGPFMCTLQPVSEDDFIPFRDDILNGEPQVGERLSVGGNELPVGLGTNQVAPVVEVHDFAVPEHRVQALSITVIPEVGAIVMLLLLLVTAGEIGRRSTVRDESMQGPESTESDRRIH